MPIRFLIGLLIGCAWLGAAEDLPVAQPSVNQGKTGIYQAETKINGCSYFVDANAYNPERPAGLYLFFHGQNGQGGAQHFGTTESAFLKPHNLIGINMCYADGDNGKDTAGKVRAAKIAVAQVIADYRVVVGRGVVASFSGGGMPLGLWWNADGAKAGTIDFPFTHVSLYSSNFRADIPDTSRTSWFISVGTDEWTLANLGESQSRAATQAYLCVRRKGNLDVDFMISGKGHTIPDSEIVRSAAGFARSDLVLAPMFAADEAPIPALRKYIDGANAHALGATLAALDNALAKKNIAADDVAALTAIQVRIEAQVTAMRNLMNRLVTDDPILASYYGRAFVAFLGKHEAGKAIAEQLADLGKTPEATACTKAYAAFIDLFPKLFNGAPSLDGDHKHLLEQLATVGPPGSLVTRMCREFATLPARN